MKRTALHLLLVILVLFPLIAYSSDDIPNANLRVTIQEKYDGEIHKGLYVLELSCLNSQCSLSSVSLNVCMVGGSGEKVFYPSVQYSSTWLGNLKVRNVGQSLVVQETGSDAFGSYVNNLQFNYESRGKDKFVNRLIGFSGGSVKNSDFLKKVLTVEYVPLPKADQVMKLDCSVLLPGIDKK